MIPQLEQAFSSRRRWRWQRRQLAASFFTYSITNLVAGLTLQTGLAQNMWFRSSWASVLGMDLSSLSYSAHSESSVPGAAAARRGFVSSHLPARFIWH